MLQKRRKLLFNTGECVILGCLLLQLIQRWGRKKCKLFENKIQESFFSYSNFSVNSRSLCFLMRFYSCANLEHWTTSTDLCDGFFSSTKWVIATLVILSDKTFRILGKFFAISCMIMHYCVGKYKKYQFLARILKEIYGLMKFLQDKSGSWNISTLS